MAKTNCQKCGELFCADHVKKVKLPKIVMLHKDGLPISTDKANICRGCLENFSKRIQIQNEEDFGKDLKQAEYQKSNMQLLTNSHWVLRRSDGSLLDNNPEDAVQVSKTGYEKDDMKLFSVILTLTLSTFSRVRHYETRMGNNRVQTDSRFSLAWKQIHNKMTAKYEKDTYNEMCCGPFALLFALI